MGMPDRPGPYGVYILPLFVAVIKRTSDQKKEREQQLYMRGRKKDSIRNPCLYCSFFNGRINPESL